MVGCVTLKLGPQTVSSRNGSQWPNNWKWCSRSARMSVGWSAEMARSFCGLKLFIGLKIGLYRSLYVFYLQFIVGFLFKI